VIARDRKERPILFGAPMVRAILAGTKTQTRRVVKQKHLPFIARLLDGLLDGRWNQRPLPYGQTGDRLWVREAWARYNITQDSCDIAYRASCDKDDSGERDGYWTEGRRKEPLIVFVPDVKWRPSIHMPRWASRITLEITAIRVERLQDISEQDAEAEGVKNSLHLQGGRFARDNFAHLWWSLHGDGSWEANPWVWVIEFKRVTP